MKRKYKYYCRKCKKVTNWTIEGPRDNVEYHTCVICKDIQAFVTDEQVALEEI